jgi:mono/diheme cytochrome c family protein
MKRRSVALLGRWFLVVGALGCEARDPTPAGRGARIFVRTCAGCHGADGRGALRAGLVKPPRDLTNPGFQVQMTNEQLRHSIRIGKGQMPAFGGLMSDDEIADVIAFVRTLVPPGTVLPPGAVLPQSAVPPGTVLPPSAVPQSAVPQSAVPQSAVPPGVLGLPSNTPLVSPPTAQGASVP